MRKVIGEILALLWKVFRLLVWKWLRPILGKVVFFGLLFIGVIVAVIILATRL